MVNVMLLHAKLNFNLWGEALLTVCHVLNKIPMKKNEISPYDLWKGRKPNIGYFKVWGVLLIARKWIQIKQNWVQGPLSVHL